MNLSDVTSALSSAAPYAGAITALANLGIDITKAVTPDEIATYENEHQQRIKQAADLVSGLVAKPDADTERAINDFDDELCAREGCPIVGGIPGVTVTIRVDRWLAHVTGISAGIRDHAIINAYIASATNGGQKQQPVAPTK